MEPARPRAGRSIRSERSQSGAGARLLHDATGALRGRGLSDGMRRFLSRVVKTQCLVVLTIVLASSGTALAHHGWSGYDAEKRLNLTGTIREYGYDNPHGFVRLQMEGEKGKTWMVILAPPSRMEQRGLARDFLKPGTKATVVGYPHREKTDEMRAERITIADKTTELR